ncbi:L,D-transpeptidase [Rubritalea tangerina]|uniref:L,D-transpeptidase family protein n=1 Tax=Rubritalea tangerina TaxID=430798 RepID=A0ABW4Z757_9BACT
MRSLVFIWLSPLALLAQTTQPTALSTDPVPPVPNPAEASQLPYASPPKAQPIDEGSGQDIKIPKDREEIARLQIFLDQQNFGPGVLDGKMGTYTKMAIEAYNFKFGRKDSEWDKVKEDARQSVPTLYATAIVPEIATKYVDTGFRWGDNRGYQATRKDMPYRSIAEFMAERYHTTVDFLKLINGKTLIDNATVRTAMRVPNIEPFRIENMAHGRTYKSDPVLSQRWAVIDTTKHQIRIYEPLAPIDPPTTEPASEQTSDLVEAPTRIEIVPDSAAGLPRAMIVEDDPQPDQQLTIHDEHRAEIVAAYPITPGKPQFIRRGTWKMNNSIEFPTWRFDDSLLKTGQRSTTSLTIPAGPNNPVGVHWMGLSRRGIGIHGTDKPERIGRGRSAGCIRMANWDVVKLPKIIRPGATVIIK